MSRPDGTDAIKIPRLLLKLTAVWPVEKPTVFQIFWETVDWILLIGFYATMLIEALHEYDDFLQLSPVICMLVSFNSYGFKLFGFRLQRTEFLKIIKILKDPIFLQHSLDLDYYLKNAIFQFTVLGWAYIGACGGVVVSFAIYPFLDNKPLPIPFPYDLGHFVLPFYVFEIIALGVGAWNNGSLDLLTTGLMSLAAAYFDILREKLIRFRETALEKNNHYINENLDKLMEEELIKCILYHYKIIELVQSIEKVFSFGLLMQFLGSILVICNTGFSFILIEPFSMHFIAIAVYFTVMMSQLAMYCWYGNEVILKSAKIVEACYLGSWYQCSPKIRKYLIIIMQRSRRPLVLTAANFANLSLQLYGSIMQWSYSYFTLLRRMYINQRALENL